MTENTKKRIMSGMRPTGKLHIGHYMGVLQNWIDLQNKYDCFFCIADWHALTTKFDQTQDFKQNIREVALDWLASGINSETATIYVQSLVPQTAELHLYFSMVTPQNWVERDPTLKDMVKIIRGDREEKDISKIVSYGLLGYPVLQTADILSFNAELVPVGKDQLAHLEFSRDLVRRFNYVYKTDYLKEPVPKLTEIPLLKGIDGQKMGKSFNNDIKISDSEEITTKKIMQAITDRSRIKKTDPGHPEECEVVCPYYDIFADKKTAEEAKEKCRKAEWGCADCKRNLAVILNDYFKAVRTKRSELEQNIDYVDSILEKGSQKAREEAEIVLKEVKNIIQMY
ncbi:MAG: tryptophan--tRNA ligase [Candidatus Gastranaerophilales bacterium]|nr:tryptophan--tRNA ligase [Candidatus Gastranaerophilales bacterium]